MPMRIYFLFASLIFFINHSLCQNDLNRFLKGFEKEESVLFQNQKVNYLANVSFNLPFIEKLEFRTETNDFDLRKQEYLIRVSPNSLKSIKTQKQYQETVQYMTKMELEATQNNALRKRYDLIVDFVFQKKILAIKYKQQTLLNDKVTLLKRSISLPGFDILELIEAEDDQQINQQEIMDLKNAIFTLSNRIYGDIQTQSDSFQVLNIEDLKKVLQEQQPNKTTNHPILKVQSAKAYNRILEYEWEAAKSKISLAYFQTKYNYNSDPIDGFRKSISVGFGFDIPFKNAGRLDLNELQINIFESESQYRNFKTQLVEQKHSSFNKLDNLIQKHELVNQQLKDGQAEFVLQEYQKIAEAPPKAIIKLRENTLRTTLLVQKLEYEIMQSYIEYLDYSGLLIQKPLTNYLTKGLNSF
jgi:hypothetical protein